MTGPGVWILCQKGARDNVRGGGSGGDRYCTRGVPPARPNETRNGKLEKKFKRAQARLNFFLVSSAANEKSRVNWKWSKKVKKTTKLKEIQWHSRGLGWNGMILGIYTVQFFFSWTAISVDLKIGFLDICLPHFGATICEKIKILAPKK